MKVFLFDLRDATEDFARNLGHVLAGALGTEMQWVGPAPMMDLPGRHAERDDHSSETLVTETVVSTDRAKRWCPHCKRSTDQDRLSDVSWMCGACCQVLTRFNDAKPPYEVATDVGNQRRKKPPTLKQLTIF